MGLSDAATAFSFTTSPEGLVLIGSGTTNYDVPIPIDHYWYDNSYTQSIFLQNEINKEGNIEAIAYYWNGGGALNAANEWTIYMGHVQKAQFDYYDDLVPSSEMTQVFEGTLDISATEGWIMIPLDTPFSYNNVDNLIVAVLQNQDDYDWDNDGYFHSTSTDYARSIIYEDYSPIDPDDDWIYYDISYGIPNILLYVASDDEPTELDIPEIHIRLIDGNTVLSWDAVENANSYNIYATDDPYAPGSWNKITTVTASPFTFDGAAAKQFFKVTADTENLRGILRRK